MRASAEIIRETTATTRRTLEARLDRVEARLDHWEERFAQLEATLQQYLDAIRSTASPRAAQSRADALGMSAQHARDRAHQMADDARRMAQAVQRRNGHRDA